MAEPNTEPLKNSLDAQQSERLRGHRFRRAALTKPSYCHGCSAFIWGLIGFQCEVCNFMSHEKCLKTQGSTCPTMMASLVKVPVSHCFGLSCHRKGFCSVCRKQIEEKAALRCEVCELHVHIDCVAFSVADCRECHLDKTLLQVCMCHGAQETVHVCPHTSVLQRSPLLHHWREGNLGPDARCSVCKRSCGSGEVPTGTSCEWCGIKAHSACAPHLAPECTLGQLHSMILPPDCVYLKSLTFTPNQTYRILEPVNAFDVCPREMGPDVRTASVSDSVKVFDGNDALRRGDFRLVPVSKTTRLQELLEAALQVFYLPCDQQSYELEALDNNVQSGFAGGAWLLRFRGPDSTIRVNLDWAGSWQMFNCRISADSTTESVLADTLAHLHTESQSVSNFQLQEVYVNGRQVQTQILAHGQNIAEKLQQIRAESLRRMNQTCFYIAKKQNFSVESELLIRGLPLLLDRERYWELLQKHLSPDSRLVKMSNVYAGQGEVVLLVSCGLEAHRIFTLTGSTRVEKQSLTSLVVPKIMHQNLDQDSSPLLVFVNQKSGGLKGSELLYKFRKLLNPHQVIDLCNCGCLIGFHIFRELPSFRVLVCGGDGTVGWVLGVLEAVRNKLLCRDPAFGILPLGTGNDLARILGWGSGYSGEDLALYLSCMNEAEEVLMDRWTILLDSPDQPPKIVHMNNYFGLGIDAELSLDFHLAREDEPGKFTSSFHNKGVYVKVGLQKITATRSLHRHLAVQVDGQNLLLPNIEGLIFLNIPSWGSGADLWGSEVDSSYREPSIADGLLEVVGVTGVVHMGQVQGGLRSGIRLAQGSYIRLSLSKATAVQVDGEPWIQQPGDIIVSAAGPKVRMLRKGMGRKN
ncbi:diacylglycerol kinase theta-like isoform X1 [Synchiropus splendidus]|uniref:diacylglycerol kinase theta-like isoform X1 n=1 Tax=Synchiropus splendidus TaxID=270530 RepID=UPI00237E9B6A|nr:diacylglycerol kinase theta-like isoform X1 [Synchiropus splendidus]